MALKRPRDISQPLLLLSGLVILAGSLMIYFFILKGVFGRFETSDLLPDPAGTARFIFGEKPKAAILYSDYTQNLLPPGSTWMQDNIRTWKRFFDMMSIKYDVINDDEVESGHLRNYNLLVLPGTKSLSDKEVVEIKKYIDAGGSIYATSGTASYSEDGKWRGWEFLSDVFGVRFVTDLGEEETKVHTLRGGLPLTANIPTGYPLKIATWDKPIAAEVLDPRTVQASFWYNYRLEDGLVREEIQKSAGIAYGSYGEGRFVWMGFEINSVAGIQDDFVFFEKLFRNSLNWLTHRPVAYVKEWPEEYSAAALIIPVIGDESYNIYNLFDILQSYRIKSSFLIDHKTAEENYPLTKKLNLYGNIALNADRTEIISNRKFTTEEEFNKYVQQLEKARIKMESFTGSKISGIKSDGDITPDNLRALTEAGFKYILSDSVPDRSVPKNIIFSKGNIVSLAKTGHDDYSIIRDFNLTDPVHQFFSYQEDIDRVLFESGMYVFMPHTEYQCRPENVNVIAKVIEELNSKNFWITTAEEISHWYSKKSNVELGVELRGKNRIAIRITNHGTEAIEDLIINVELSAPAVDISISSEIIGIKPAAFTYNIEKNIIHVSIRNLNKGESRTYYVDFSRPNA